MTARAVLYGIKAELTAGPRRSWEVKEEDRGNPSVWHDGEVAFPIGRCPDCGVEAEYDPADATFIASAPATVARLSAAVESVLALHKTRHYDKWGRNADSDQGHGGWCDVCLRFDGPSCPTVAAIENALGEGQ